MKITWYGHSCFRIETGRSRILIDPFLTGNPTFENSGIAHSSVAEGVTHVALTHGHDDHIGDTVQICRQTGATLIAVYEIAMYLASQGVANLEPGNTGGRIRLGDFDLTFVQALHSSGTTADGKSIYLGNPCGLVIRPESGPSVYHMGDTEVFSDMALIQELHAPEIGIVPIGDRFTMGAASAAFACRRFFRFRKVLPCHYGTFPMLAATADDFIAEASGLDVMVPAPGEVLEF